MYCFTLLVLLCWAVSPFLNFCFPELQCFLMICNMPCCVVLVSVVHCGAIVHTAAPSSIELFSVMLTLRCSWSWAWCWRVNFSCCFWNSLISSCFWICCCFWMRSSSCCSCLSHSPGSEPGPSILRSVRRSNGDKGSANGTSDLMSTVAHKGETRENEREQELCQLVPWLHFISIQIIKPKAAVYSTAANRVTNDRKN